MLVIVDKNTRQIICIRFSNGKKHGFKIFKESKIHIDTNIKVITDTGFLGIAKLHANSVLPIKKTKGKPLTKEEKIFNRSVSSDRIINENVIGFIKRFRIVSERCRNRRRRFELRFSLICWYL